MKTCFLAASTIDPKTKKRIQAFQCYSNVTAIYAKRKTHNTDIMVENCNQFPIEIDLPDANHILGRLVVSQKFQKNAYALLIKEKPDIIYAETFDCLAIACKYKRKYPQTTIFYEVADLRAPYFKEQKGIKNKLISCAIKTREKHYFQLVNYLVVTSEKFYTERYESITKKENVIFLPNMPEKAIFENFKKANDEKDADFTVGFVGGLRYIDQMLMLVDAAELAKVKIVFAGTPYDKRSQELIDYCKDKSNVTFTGEYNFQRDIVDIYSKLDCVYSVYDAANANVRIALPNKLYEAILCSLPIIVAKNTYLCELAESWGVGVGVKYNDVKELSNLLIKLKNDKAYYAKFVNRCNEKKKEMDYTIYNNRLLDIIKALS